MEIPQEAETTYYPALLGFYPKELSQHTVEISAHTHSEWH
jgi:hypothetical protein